MAKASTTRRRAAPKKAEQPAPETVTETVQADPAPQLIQPSGDPPTADAPEGLTPELVEALNGRAQPVDMRYQNRVRRRRELFAAILPAVLDAGPLDSPATVESIRHGLMLADLALVMEEQHEGESGLPLSPRARR